MEPLMTVDNSRFSLFPIKNKIAWDFYKKALASFWVADEIDFSTDYQDFTTKLSENERTFVKYILAFFSTADGIINENLVGNFCNEITSPEVRCFYGFQIAIENIHQETYALFIDTLITENLEREQLFQSIDNFPFIKKKADWAMKWMSNDRPFAERLVAFSIVEGLFFSGSFASIFWLKKRNLMKGLTFSNELIARDEGLHYQFAVYLHSELNNKCSKERVLEIVKEAVEIEKEFFNTALDVRLIGMNSVLMMEYIEFIADRILYDYYQFRHYNTKNPFEFMELISLETKTNFFESRVSQYQKASVLHNDINMDTILDDF
jgi:ribonucleotide reductase beta subunit family protein with ferritin-like domain